MLSLLDLARALDGARLVASAADPGAIRFGSVGTDSRTLAPGALFVALTGPSFDGHDFITTALDRGAAAVLCERIPPGETRPAVLVPDALTALQQLAAHWRSLWTGELIAVTGSNGKTSVTQMIARILAAQYPDDGHWATQGNLNNHIGVPLTLLGLRHSHRAAVVELGTNHPGEIAVLARITRPTVALVNNAQREHQEFLHGVMATARENGEVFGALCDTGVAVYPRDPLHEPVWAALAGGRRRLRFGLAGEACAAAFRGQELLLHAGDRSGNATTELRLPDGTTLPIALRAPGRHVALNAAAAAACALAAGCTVTAIAAGLEAFEPVRGRGNALPLAGGGLLVDDSYNANPDSVLAAIDCLAGLAAPQALVLGDMGETGEDSAAFHREVLEHAAARGLSAIWLLGEAFGEAQAVTAKGWHFPDVASLLADLGHWIAARQAERRRPTVWVKGSRFMRMERVVTAVAAPSGERAADGH